MSANEPHINLLVDEQYNCHYPIVVALYIEHIAVVTHIVHRIERLLHVSEGVPVSIGYTFIPVTQRYISICMFGNEIPYHGK